MIGEEKTKRIEKYLFDFESGKTDKSIKDVILNKLSEEVIDYTIFFSLGIPSTIKYKGDNCKDIFNILIDK